MPLHLLWHQLVGISSIIKKTFTAEPVERLPSSVLIADAVGVGKTALTMGIIAFIINAFYMQEGMAGWGVADKVIESSATETRLAPIISCHLVSMPAHHTNTPDREHPHFAGCVTMSDLPHIIVIGNSLVHQWTNELHTFFASGKIEIYIFPTAESKFSQFWEGDWKTSKTPYISRIILIPHSVSCKAIGVCDKNSFLQVMTTFGKAFDVR